MKNDYDCYSIWQLGGLWIPWINLNVLVWVYLRNIGDLDPNENIQVIPLFPLREMFSRSVLGCLVSTVF